MKVCIFAFSLPIHFMGGMETHTQDLASDLAKQNIKIVILTARHPKNVLHETINENLEVYYDEIYSPTDKKLQESLANKFLELDAKYDFDLIHSQSSAAAALIYMGYKKKPIIATLHGHWREGVKPRFLRGNLRGILSGFKFLFNQLINSARIYKFEIGLSGIIDISDKQMTQRCRNKKLKDRTYLVYNGIDTNKFYIYSQTKVENIKRELGLVNKKILIYAGRITKVKGIHKIIQIMPEIIKKDPEVVLLILGKGFYEEELKNLVVKMQISSNVKFMGYIPHDNLVDYLNISDIFLFPSMEAEGLPLSCIEAISCGKPVIAINIGGTPSIVKNNYNGFLIPFGKHKKFLEKIVYLLNNPEIRLKFSQNSRELALLNFISTTQINNTINVYNQVLKKFKSKTN